MTSRAVCVETIYAAVYASVLDVKATECLPWRRPRRVRQARHPNTRPALPNIALRPAAVNERAEVGLGSRPEMVAGAASEASHSFNLGDDSTLRQFGGWEGNGDGQPLTGRGNR